MVETGEGGRSGRSGGRNAAGPKMEADLKQQNGSLYKDWEAGGRWQVVKVGRQRSSPWPVGYGPPISTG